jgi:hypothetical protein
MAIPQKDMRFRCSYNSRETASYVFKLEPVGCELGVPTVG